MSELTPEIAADVVAACQTGAEEAAGALSRGLDGEFAMEVGESGVYEPDKPPEGFDGPGLVIKMVIGEQAAVAILPQSTGLTPDWYQSPDATGESKLATLGQELGMLLLPESLFAEDFAAGAVANLSESLAAGGVSEGASIVPLPLSAGDKSGVLSLLWPATNHAELIKPSPEEQVDEQPDAPTDQGADPAADEHPSASPSPSTAKSPPAPIRVLRDFYDLPAYAQSLLGIKVPLMVTLAEKRENIEEILNLGPGSILTFEQPCDGPLSIEIDDHTIATGDAVKVGEKFGVRVREMTLPQEKFKNVRSAS